MRLGQIVLRLRSKDTYFKNFIGGAAELDLALQNTLKKDMAFVIPLLDDAGKNNYDTMINHIITERFGVIVAIANDSKQTDKLGFLAYDQIHNIRNDFLKALGGWIPLDSETQVCYRGGKLIELNGAYMWYQFEFEYESRIISDPITGNVHIQDSSFDDTKELGEFNTIYMQLITTPNSNIPYVDKFGNPGEMPYPDGFPNVELPNMANWIDLTDNPNVGDFSRSFASGFDVDYT